MDVIEPEDSIAKLESASTDSVLTLGAKLVALGVLIALCCWISITYTREPGNSSTLWIASGILAGILLTSPRWLWPWYMAAAWVGNVAMRFVLGEPWYSMLGLGLVSILDAVPGESRGTQCVSHRDGGRCRNIVAIDRASRLRLKPVNRKGRAMRGLFC